MDSDERQGFDVACGQNTASLLKPFFGHRRVENFLEDESVHIPLSATVLEDARDAVDYTFDFDGLVIQLPDASCVNVGLIHYLLLGKMDGSRMTNHWHLLKKHLTLTNYTAEGVGVLRKSVGTLLAFIDGGYFLNITCVPANPNHAPPMLKRETIFQAHAIGLLNALFKHFSGKLKGLCPHNLARPSLQKNNLSDLSRMNILPADQEFVLCLFNESVLAVNVDPDVALLLTITKFGQKDERRFDIRSLVNPDGIACMSYHAACNVRPRDENVELLWSRCGLQEVVGSRGTLFPVYGMREAANYQSNLDRHPLGIDQMLRQVLREDAFQLNFLQMYAVTPHCHEKHGAKHAVSRVIATCGLHIAKHRKMIADRAETYLKHVDDLSRKAGCRTSVRLEGVFLVQAGFQEVVEAKHFFIPSMLDNLLECVPMLVPFKDTVNGLGLRHVMKPVGTYLSTSLHNLLDTNKGMGGYEDSLHAYQLELAVNEFFYGRPVCHSSRPFSSALSVSASNPNSLTFMRGFLGLEKIGGASVGEAPPPLETWIKDGVQKARVHRLFPLTNCFMAGPEVIGDELVRILLSDLCQRNDNLPFAVLKGPDRPLGGLVDYRTVREFSREVCDRKAFAYPHTFGRAVDMLTSLTIDSSSCLELGLSKLKYFPCIKYWDENRNLKARWNLKDFVELHKPNCTRLEELDLSYLRNVKKYRQSGINQVSTVEAIIRKCKEYNFTINQPQSGAPHKNHQR